MFPALGECFPGLGKCPGRVFLTYVFGTLLRRLAVENKYVLGHLTRDGEDELAAWILEDATADELARMKQIKQEHLREGKNGKLYLEGIPFPYVPPAYAAEVF